MIMAKAEDKEQPAKPRFGLGPMDGLAVAGLASFSYGAWLVYEPLGFLAAGALLLAAVVLSARRG